MARIEEQDKQFDSMSTKMGKLFDLLQGKITDTGNEVSRSEHENQNMVTVEAVRAARRPHIPLNSAINDQQIAFDAKMKEKTDRNKQLAEVLPDNKRVTIGSQLGMGINNRRSMGTENFTRGFEIRISSNSSTDRDKTHFGQCEESSYYFIRGIKTYESVQLSTHSDSSNVAKKTLVHRASAKVSGKSNKTANTTKSTLSTKNKHLPSKSRSVLADSLTALHKNFRNKGTRKLLKASWRSCTQQDYACKFKKIHSWCSERETVPYAATLADCADLLSHLYTSGLQYPTIAGYRSMFSSLLPAIDNFPIGQHPYIIRLLRRVFNSRPPKVNLVPEWDLQKVLDMLQNSPFEPLLKADMKCSTYKVVFLTAITTFKRCSDIQALRLERLKIDMAEFRCSLCTFETCKFEDVIFHAIHTHANREICILKRSDDRKAYKRLTFPVVPEVEHKKEKIVLTNNEKQTINVVDLDEHLVLPANKSKTDSKNKDENQKPQKTIETCCQTEDINEDVVSIDTKNLEKIEKQFLIDILPFIPMALQYLHKNNQLAVWFLLFKCLANRFFHWTT
ncbi:unnamed protein product [Mytilus coruscus]|uniref:Tyr recombinase domain-containing protein n=1 Tax=Mytilus coruscus TaxID=42192 RepID=A0A6J8ERX5_MYTCO|nr:unnamed protein product [Mytilus coruscus]